MTLIFDQDQDSHSFDDKQNSFVDMQNSALSVLNYLNESQLDVQFFSQSHSVLFNKKYSNYGILRSAILSSGLKSVEYKLSHLIQSYAHEIPTNSTVILFSATTNNESDDLFKAFLKLEENQCDVILISIDQMAYAKNIFSKGELSDIDAHFYQKFSSRLKYDKTKRLFERIANRTYLLSPDKKLRDLYDQSVGL